MPAAAVPRIALQLMALCAVLQLPLPLALARSSGKPNVLLCTRTICPRTTWGCRAPPPRQAPGLSLPVASGLLSRPTSTAPAPAPHRQAAQRGHGATFLRLYAASSMRAPHSMCAPRFSRDATREPRRPRQRQGRRQGHEGATKRHDGRGLDAQPAACSQGGLRLATMNSTPRVRRASGTPSPPPPRPAPTTRTPTPCSRRASGRAALTWVQAAHTFCSRDLEPQTCAARTARHSRTAWSGRWSAPGATPLPHP